MNPIHERKQKERAARRRTDAALANHPTGHLIRQTMLSAIAEGMGLLNAYAVAVAMTQTEDGTAEFDGVKVHWGEFARRNT